MDSSFGTTKKVRSALPRIPFEKIARQIMGRRYSLSLVVCGDELARRLNRTYRKKDYAPNVLSFPLGNNEGEIILNARRAAREARARGVAARMHIAFLFIHGCLHLAGHKHGQKMDRHEAEIMRKLGYTQ